MPTRTIYLTDELNDMLTDMGLEAMNVSEFFRHAMLAWLTDQRPALEVDGEKLRSIPAPRDGATAQELSDFARECFRNGNLAAKEADRRLQSYLTALGKLNAAQDSSNLDAMRKALEDAKQLLAKEVTASKVGRARR